MTSPTITFAQAIEAATRDALNKDSRLQVIGLGVNYKNGADGTMGSLKEEFPSRIHDTPISEYTTTGLALGSALMGQPVVIHHGRAEFALFAADQIFNQSAKWDFMFGGGQNIPLVIRIAIGRQWGNGPQHSASYLSLFASTPGLQVVFPSTPSTAYDLFSLATGSKKGPTVILESRWLYGVAQERLVTETERLNKIRSINLGADLTIVTYGDGVLESLVAANHARLQGVNIKIIDLLSINPIDFEGLADGLIGARHVIILDPHQSAFGVGSEVYKFVSENFESDLRSKPVVLAPPFAHVPTAPAETARHYVNAGDVISTISRTLNLPLRPLVFKPQDHQFAPKIVIGPEWSTQKY